MLNSMDPLDPPDRKNYWNLKKERTLIEKKKEQDRIKERDRGIEDSICREERTDGRDFMQMEVEEIDRRKEINNKY